MADGDEPARDDLSLRWSGQVTLTQRILAVNILALLLLAGGFFYLDSYRLRVIDTRVAQSIREVRLIAQALAAAPARDRDTLLIDLSRDSGTRIRVYDDAGGLSEDSRALGGLGMPLIDPDRDGWDQRTARWIDAGIDTVVGAARAPLFRERRGGDAWPDVAEVRRSGGIAASVWRAPDRTPVITAAAPLPGGAVVMTNANARDITETVRIERLRLSLVLLFVTLLSVSLSLFLARTIVTPLRRLARAAVRVRLGRAREVVVPRLPSRRDELGMLARALSDMSLALRTRIDATEAFAADVAHELKNPLASLRSAVEGLDTVADPALRDRLLAIVRDDVHRLDRLITDIAEASRLDAELSRAKFEPIDVTALTRGLVDQRTGRGVERGIRLRLDRVPMAPTLVMGVGMRLERVIDNLIDNALSFSPDGATIAIGIVEDGEDVVIAVEDQGPGVPEEERETVFLRFQSVRPADEAFGQHSGLGLAIARTIVEGHGGAIAAESRVDGAEGARFLVRLPLAPELDTGAAA